MSKSKKSVGKGVKKVAVVYVRASSGELGRDSLRTQLKLLHEYGANHGFEVVPFPSDGKCRDATSEPKPMSGTVQQEFMRRLQNAMQWSYSAALGEAIRNGIRKKSKAGKRLARRGHSR